MGMQLRMKWKDKKLLILLGINIILLLFNITFATRAPAEKSISTGVAGVTPAESESNLKKKIALTFDDGPHPEYTPMLLDGLKEREVSAAFFLMGKNAEKYPEIVERMHKEGHTIGNHSYSHVQLSSLEDLEACKEITKANKVVESITGKEPDYIRPPFGSWNPDLDCITNMIVVLWDVDTLVTRV